MLFYSKTCFPFVFSNCHGRQIAENWAQWEIHNKVDWQKTKRIKIKSRNLLLSPKVHLLIMADPKYAALPGIVSSYDLIILYTHSGL